MNRILFALLVFGVGCSSRSLVVVTSSPPMQPAGHFQMENLDRGLVAVSVIGGVYVGWRMFGYEYNPPSQVWYKVYRDGVLITQQTGSTNILDYQGTIDSQYSVRAVIDDVEQPISPSVSVWSQNYLRIPLNVPPGGKNPGPPTCAGDSYTYDANDASVGDLDGDGEYEIVLKWQPTNARDNSQSGCTGKVYLDAYKLNGTFLWRIDLGVNIRAGAHYTQFVVYDFDGDGMAEVAVKTAPGTKDGTGKYLSLGPAAIDDDSIDYRSKLNPPNMMGLVLTGPEYLSVFAGLTGAELATVNFEVARGDVAGWGDNVGNRVDNFLGSAGFVSDSGTGNPASGRPSILMARGYAARSTITAWNFRNGILSKIWQADSDQGTAYAGKGAHSMAVADTDGDGAQEIIYGASTINSDGTAKCMTELGGGDALHVGNLIPGWPGPSSQPSLQVFMPHEGASVPQEYDVRDADDCAIILRGPIPPSDTGRGVADDVSPDSPGAEVWTDKTDNMVSAETGLVVDPTNGNPNSVNFLIYWDADESRELEDDISITKYDGNVLLTCPQCASNNSTKKTPVLTADLLGDWREEIIWRESDNSALRLYTTTDVTARRIYTLMHDPQYRMQVTSEQTGFNQPPHPSFHIGDGMVDPPVPDMGFPSPSPK